MELLSYINNIHRTTFCSILKKKNIQFWFNFEILSLRPKNPQNTVFFLGQTLKLDRFPWLVWLSEFFIFHDMDNYFFHDMGIFFPWLGNHFFTVDHVLESLDSHGKFWCFFPSHGNQNFLSRTWTFHYFFFQDMVPSLYVYVGVLEF